MRFHVAVALAAMASFASGAPATFGIVETTRTDGCSVAMAVELDTMFGTAFHMAGTQWDWSGTAACTR